MIKKHLHLENPKPPLSNTMKENLPKSDLHLKGCSNYVEDRIKKIKGASVLLPERSSTNEILDVEKFGITLKTMILEEDPDLASFLNINAEDILITSETASVITFALSPNDFKEVICAMKYINRAYQKEGFTWSATHNQNITESLIQQSAHIVQIEK